MKWLFGLLLLANVAYFMWQFAGPPRARDTAATHAPRTEINPEKLKRLNEPGVLLQPRARATKPEVVAPVAPAAEVHAQCYTVGPFTSVDAQTLAGIRLQELGLSYLERTQERSEPVYRLFEGPFNDVAAAEKRRRLLTRRGIKDHALTNEGAKQYTIALGLFVQTENAQAAQRDLATRGARPKLAQSKRAVTNFWLDTHALAPASVERLKAAWNGIAGIEVNEKTCAEAPAVNAAPAPSAPPLLPAPTTETTTPTR